MGRKLIYIFLFVGLFGYSQTNTVAEWYALWETAYPIDSANGNTSGTGSPLQMWVKSTSNGANQEHYYLAWNYKGVVDVWKANGQEIDLWRALKMAYNVRNASVPCDGTEDPNWSPGEYQVWPRERDVIDPQGAALWESYFWRYVTHLLRVMYQSPVLLSTAHNGDPDFPGTTWQDVYNDMLPWVEQHLWNKWEEANTDNFYRSRVHMAQHWGWMGMELYIMTGTQKYLNVFQEINYTGMPSNYPGANIRDEVYNIGDAYSWTAVWFSSTAVQDRDHAESVYNSIPEMYEQGYHWTLDDVTAFSEGFKQFVYGSSLDNTNTYVDGSGSFTSSGHVASCLPLARYDSQIMGYWQNQVTTIADIPGSVNWINMRLYAIGGAALAQAYQNNTISYPENLAVTPPIQGLPGGKKGLKKKYISIISN